MPIPLDQPTAAGPPAVKFNEIGSYIDVGIVLVEQVQSRDYDTGDPEMWADGNPKLHPRITGLVIAQQGATVGKDDDARTVDLGDIVAIYAQGGRWFPYRDALKQHGTVNVGDVMRWKFESTKPARNPRHAPLKVFDCQLRAPRGDDGDLVTRCEAAHHEMRSRVVVDTAPATSNGGNGLYDDAEVPF